MAYGRKYLRLIARPVPPTALFVIDDELALSVHQVLHEYGLTVPGDISIIAPGDVLDYSKPYVPQFTTMRINTEAVGSTTGELMVNRIKHSRHKWYGLKVNQELVDRGSCSSPLVTAVDPSPLPPCGGGLGRGGGNSLKRNRFSPPPQPSPIKGEGVGAAGYR